MIYIIKQEEVYQNKVNSGLVSTCNCKIVYSEENWIGSKSSEPGWKRSTAKQSPFLHL